jgi:putative protease
MPIFEDEHGTYIMNSRDLRAVEHVQRLVAMGIDCLKIEGRTKSHYYTARTTRVYRQAIDDAVAGRPFDIGQLAELESLANRGYTDAFYMRHPSKELQNYREGASRSARAQFVAEVVGHDPDTGLSELLVKNKFAVGDELELITPSGLTRFRLDAMQDREGQAVEIALGGGWRVCTRLPVDDATMGIIARVMQPDNC